MLIYKYLPFRQIQTGAEDRARTGHPDLGKVVLYQMSYFRRGKDVKLVPAL